MSPASGAVEAPELARAQPTPPRRAGTGLPPHQSRWRIQVAQNLFGSFELHITCKCQRRHLTLGAVAAKITRGALLRSSPFEWSLNGRQKHPREPLYRFHVLRLN